MDCITQKQKLVKSFTKKLIKKHSSYVDSLAILMANLVLRVLTLKTKLTQFTAMSSNKTTLWKIRNKAAIALQCKSNVKLIAALLFIPYSSPI